MNARWWSLVVVVVAFACHHVAQRSMLVASICGIELGADAMYRSGWSVAAANTSTQAIVAVVLVVVGLLAFGEHLTITRAVGLGPCVGGAGLVVAR